MNYKRMVISIAVIVVLLMASVVTGASKKCPEGAEPIPGDKNDDGFVSDHELLVLTDKWEKGEVSDFEQLAATDIWETFGGSEDSADGSFLTQAHAGRKISVYAQGDYYINKKGHKVGFRFDQLRVTSRSPHSALQSLAVESEGDMVDFDYFRYRDSQSLQTFVCISASEISWMLWGFGNEGWSVRIEDNGDHYVKVKIMSSASYSGNCDPRKHLICHGADADTEFQTIEIRW